MKISVTGDSTAGNPITISHDVTVDLATVAISINAIASDDVINAAEKGRIWCSLAPPPTWKPGRPSP